MNDDPTTIELATGNLQKGIEKLLRKASAKRPHLDVQRAETRALRLVRHIHHLLFQLLQKRKSLQALIKWLGKEWKTRLKWKLSADNPQQTQKVLVHAFQCLVRCQDGLMLLTSGECRHPVDIQEASDTKFPSRLATLNERADGYTKLYSGEAYSGYGWDEYSNETVGIQVRLVEILKPFHKSPWEYLEGSSQLLESLLDRQEDVVKALKQDLQVIKEEMTVDITKQLAKPIIFSTQDKMERLQVLIPARAGQKEQRISIARLANTFQIVGSSVLPNEFQTVQHWDRNLSLYLTESGKDESKKQVIGKKRRRLAVLDDSDSSGCEEHDKKKPMRNDANNSGVSKAAASTGLAVRVETTKVRTEAEISLKSIKEQMGVDMRALEASRQDLELEGLGKQDGNTRSYEEEQVNRLTRNLERVEQRTGVDYDANEVWDAREELRRAYMELGIWALESSKNGNLEHALSSFEQAKKLTIELQQTHAKDVAKVNDQTERARLISRRLLFLLSEASTNVGITLMETAERQTLVNNKLLGKAVREFRQTRAFLAQLRGQVDVEIGKCAPNSTTWIGLKLDSLEGDILDSMVCRCLGKAIWLTGQCDSFSSAETLFEQGWSFFRGFNIGSRTQLIPILLGVVGACVESCSTLASLGYAELEILELNSTTRDKGDVMLRIVCKALTKQTEILREVEGLRRTSDSPIQDLIKSYEREHPFPSSSASQKSLDDVKSWWRKCLEQMNDFENQQSKPPLPNAGLSGFGTHGRSTPSVVFQGQSQRQQSSRTAGAVGWMENQSATQHHPNHATELVDIWNPPPVYTVPTKFRKWGDELIEISISTKKNQGREEDLLQFPYPTIPPPIPSELLLLYDPDTLRLRKEAA
jgi:hypothetical protein